MSLFGVEMSHLIKNSKIPGVESRAEDLILDPALIFPPPHMQGKVTAVRVEGDNIVLSFGDKSSSRKIFIPATTCPTAVTAWPLANF